jgi:hypothetical protein
VAGCADAIIQSTAQLGIEINRSLTITSAILCISLRTSHLVYPLPSASPMVLIYGRQSCSAQFHFTVENPMWLNS